MNLQNIIKQEERYYRDLTSKDNIFIHAVHNAIVQENRDLDGRIANALIGLKEHALFKDCIIEYYLKEDNYLRTKRIIGAPGKTKALIPNTIRRDDYIYERLGKRRVVEEQYPFRKEFAEKNNLTYSLVAPTNSRGILIVSRSKEPFTAYHKSFLMAYAHSTLNFTIENATIYEQVEKEATIDGLTGILNKNYLLKKLKEEFLREKRVPTKGLSVLMIDVDHFKHYNDNYGHQKGDCVLVEIAKILTENTRGIDTVGRYGGDEFTIVLPNTTKEDAVRVAEKLIKVSSKKFSNKKCEEMPTLSIGIAHIYDSNQNRSYKRLIGAADDALYKAKKRRNAIAVG